jgi:hypothetical protein
VKRFLLNRLEDETGISGTGYVAEGVEFSSGKVAMRWRTETSSMAFYESIVDVDRLHGHSGRTVIEWIDSGPLVPGGHRR